MSTPIDITFSRSLDEMLESLPTGSVRRAIANNLYGINFRQTGNVVPRTKDNYGYTFFTRPQLNLSTPNITNFRSFYSLLNQNPASYQRYTRCMLDPRMGTPNEPSVGIRCPFVDPSNPFIPVLSNNIVSNSGWPDLSVPIYTSEAGLYGQEFSMVDGVTNHFEAFDLDISFRNMKGNPVIYLFYIWIKYMTLTVEGILNPYFDMIAENEIDSNTRIYRLVMDQRKRYVTQIACTGASFPMSVPTGAIFDFNTDKPLNASNTEFNIRFRNMGFVAFEDIVKYWFNQTLAIFNPSMSKQLAFDMAAISNSDAVTREDPSMVYMSTDGVYMRIPYALAQTTDRTEDDYTAYSLNHKAVPYINLYTSELEWWVKNEDYVDYETVGKSNYVIST